MPPSHPLTPTLRRSRSIAPPCHWCGDETGTCVCAHDFAKAFDFRNELERPEDALFLPHDVSELELRRAGRRGVLRSFLRK